jgi:hypothetical protein
MYGGILDNVGTISQQDITFPQLTRSNFTDCQPNTSPATVPCTETWRGWNLLANPYPCPIDWDATGLAWSKPSDMNNALYKWNPALDAYQAYLGTTGTPGVDLGGVSLVSGSPNNIIPSNQAFFVKMVSGTTGSMVVRESAKVTTLQGSFLRSASVVDNAVQQVKVRLLKNGVNHYGYDGVIRFDASSSYGFDIHKDVDAISGGLNFSYSMLGENSENLIMNTVPLLSEQRIIPLMMSYNGNGDYRFSFLESATVQNGAEMYLRDNYLGTITNMLQADSYSFEVNSADGSAMSDRFEIIISPSAVTGVDKVVEGIGFGIHPNPVNSNAGIILTIRNQKPSFGAISVSDVLGRVVFNSNLNLSSEKESQYPLSLNLSSGVYTVKLSVDGKVMTEKLVVR